MTDDPGEEPANARDSKGRKNGLWRESDPHGGEAVGTYRGDRREGLWRHYFRDGTVRSESIYHDGVLDGACVWYRATGGLLQKGSFDKGQKSGLWERWSPEGNLIDRGDRIGGKKTGEWQYFNADGSIERTTNHRPRQD
jgi:antitoxin component YwqK of YwqJK toxin-antitoxin module